MNMISTAFPIETDASNKTESLAKKFASVWEKKNSKAARAGGVSLMALTLAACGAEDDTPFAQSDIDAATAPLSASLVTAQTQAATALVAQAAAETQAATALVAQAAAEATAATALVAQAAAEATAATLVVSTAAKTAEAAAAVAAQATAEASLATMTTAKEAAEAAQATAEASLATSEASLATVQASYDALVAPKVLAFTTTADSLVGASGNDSVTAAAGTLAATDSIIDTSAVDSDVLTIVSSDTTLAFTSSNIETIDVTINNLNGSRTVDTANFTGVTGGLTVTRGDVVVGGATLTGGRAIVIDNADSSALGSITAGAATSSLTVTSAGTDLAGHVVNADAVTTTVSVDGAATINAALATGTVAIDNTTNAAAAENVKASVINAANATTVTTHVDLTGTIEINAASATTVTVNNAPGGATVNASTANTADATVAVNNIDLSGATITVGTGADDTVTLTNIGLDVSVEGTAAATDAATISGAGHIELDIDGAGQNVDIITLSGNGAAVVYDLAAPTTGTAASFTKAGTQTVEIMGDVSEFSGVTITNIDELDMIAGPGAMDGSFFSGVGKIDFGVNNSNAALTLVSGSTVEVTVDQTTGFDINFSAAGGADMSLIAGDDTGVNSVGTIALGNLDVAAGDTVVGNVNIDATVANLDTTGVNLGLRQNLIITGDENVTLSDVGGAETVRADSVNAGASSGVITINVEDSVTNTADVDLVTTGSGADVIEADVGTGTITVAAGGANDTITITNVGDAATFDGGGGNDTFNVNDVSVIVLTGGDGSDNFATNLALGATIVGGEGTDTITMDQDTAVTFAATFAFSGIEELDITAVTNKAISITGAQLAGNSTLILDGNAALDVFNVSTGSTAATARSADLSNVTVKTGATVGITVTGGAGVDTITGGVAGESFTQTVLDDTIVGGTGAATAIDTLTAITTADNGTGTASVINMSTGVVSSTAILSATTLRTVNDADAAAGTMSTLFNDTIASNNAAVTTFSEIESVVGTGGRDYILGSDSGETISGLAGNDFVNAGNGDDTVIVEDTDTSVNGGGGIDTIQIGSDVNMSTDTFAGFEKLVITVQDKDLTVDAADASAFTDITGVNGGGAEKFIVVGTTGVDTIDLSGLTRTDMSIDVDLAAGADNFTGSSGIDLVDLGGTDSAVDTINFAFGAGAAGRLDDYDEFEAANDIINFTGTTDVVAVGSSSLDTDGFVLNVGAGNVSIADGLTIMDNGVAGVTTLASMDGTGLAALLADNDLAVSGASNTITFDDDGDIFYIAASDGTNTGMFRIEDATAGSTTIAAADITLLFTLDISDAGSLIAAGFTDFA
jgi:hypothetical protein